MRTLTAQIASVSDRTCTVLIQGDSGTGKELAAQHIHYSGPLKDQPFVPVDCSTLRDTLFESQLFGHVIGAFTGADRDAIGFFRAADGGTLFLDEIGELEPQVQARLLRCIQERSVVPLGSVEATPVNVRIIAATHRNLEEMVGAGEFRQDLFFRLNVVSLDIPCLKHRPSDVVPLAKHFLATFADFYNEPVKTLSPDACAALEAYDWPGNVREVANAFERAYALCPNPVITTADLPAAVRHSASQQENFIGKPLPVPIPVPAGVAPLDHAERTAVENALKATDGNQARAANLLRIDRRRLYRLVRRFNLGELTRKSGRSTAKSPITPRPEVDSSSSRPKLLKASAAAERLGCDAAFVRREVQRGNLTGYRIGPRGDIRIPAEALEAYLSNHAVQNNAE